MFPSGIRGGIISANAISDVTSAWKKKEREKACRASVLRVRIAIRSHRNYDKRFMYIPNIELSPLRDRGREESLSLSLSLSLSVEKKLKISGFVFILYEKGKRRM